MANFQQCPGFPQGYDEAAYLLRVPMGQARFMCLWGGGPGGAHLAVTFNPARVALQEFNDVSLHKGGAHLRAFRVMAVSIGATAIEAKLAGGEAYSKPLNVEVTGDADGTKAKVDTAFQESRRTLREALQKLESLRLTLSAVRLNLPVSVTGEDEKTLRLVEKWMYTKPLFKPDGSAFPDKTSRAGDTHVILGEVIQRINRNLACKTTSNNDPPLMRSPRPDFGVAYGQPNLGLELGEACFGGAGPNCRRDVVTHEFFHMVGIGHGERPGQKGLPFAKRPLPTPQALNSADHLSQLVAELTTGRCDACTRNSD